MLGNNYNDDPKAGKGLFLGLSIGSLLLISLIAWGAWLLVSPRINQISGNLALVIYISLRVFFVVLGLGVLMVALTCITGKNLLYFKKPIYLAMVLTIRFIYPATVFFGNLFYINRERIGTSFVDVNNGFVRALHSKYPSNRILILLPHCLQLITCKHRITNDINNCTRCGACEISGLKGLSEKYHTKLAVATGGTLARRIIIKLRPAFIVAVACQRDLVSGIIDAFPIPVFGVLNMRPEGPCINTRVDLAQIEKAITDFSA